MRHPADVRAHLATAAEALGRYTLRTALSVLGVVLGVGAVIAMLSVVEGASREALAQVEALGLDNLVARSTAPDGTRSVLEAGDAARAAAVLPLVSRSSPLVARPVRASQGGRTVTATALGVQPAFDVILRLSVASGRWLTATDDLGAARRCVLGSGLARQLFGDASALGRSVRLGADYYDVVGVLRPIGTGPSGGSLAWHDLNAAALVPFGVLTGRSIEVVPDQPVDEIWLRLSDGTQAESIGEALATLVARGRRADAVTVVVPRQLLAQRYRTQRTFSVVLGSIALLALLVGGIGIMNTMLMSVVERTREIGVRRTVGATRRDVGAQFLAEALLMTLGGGLLGIVGGAGGAAAITSLAGWRTHVSPTAVAAGFLVSVAVGLAFGLYPALKAARLEPVDAMRFE